MSECARRFAVVHKAARESPPDSTASANRIGLPERRLAMGILLQALHDLDGLSPAHKFHRDALAWVRSQRTDWLGAFDCVCDCLGLDATAARAAILAGDKLEPRCERARAELRRAPLGTAGGQRLSDRTDVYIALRAERNLLQN